MGALDVNDIGNMVVREYDIINSLNIARFFIAVRETYPVSQKVHIIFDGAGFRAGHKHKKGKTRWFSLLLFFTLGGEPYLTRQKYADRNEINPE